jgi:hypothetical protein
MRIALPIHSDRISPVLDVARRFIPVEVDRNLEVEKARGEVPDAGMHRSTPALSATPPPRGDMLKFAKA